MPRRMLAGSLVKAIVAELETSDGRTMAREAFKALTATTSAEVNAQAIAALGSVSQLVDAKAGANAQAFRIWLKDIAERVAAASKVASLASVGVAVSDAEKATLARAPRLRCIVGFALI